MRHQVISLLALSAAVSVQAATPASPAFDPDDAAYAAIRRLDTIADKLVEMPVDKRDDAVFEAALQDVIALGRKTKVKGSETLHPALSEALADLAQFRQTQGKYAEALKLATEARALLRPLRQYSHNSYLQAVAVIGFVETAEGRAAAAADALAEAAEFSHDHFARMSEKPEPGMVMARSNLNYSLAMTQTRLGRVGAAVSAFKSAWDARRATFGENNPDAVASRWNYALGLYRAGRVEEAEAEVRAALDQAITHVPTKHPTYFRTFDAAAIILARVGKRGEAAELLRRSLDIRREVYGTKHVNYLSGLYNLGDLELQRERYAVAADVFDEAAVGYRAVQGATSGDALRADSFGAVAAFGASRPDALTRLEAVFAEWRRRDARERQASLDIVPALILARADAGRSDAARALGAQFAAELRAFDRARPAALAEAEALAALTALRDAAGRPAALTAARRAIEATRDEGWLNDDGELSLRARTTLETVLRIAVEADDADLALEAMHLLSGSRIASANRLLAQRLAAADPRLAEEVRLLQDATRSFRVADQVWTRALGANEGVAARRIERDAALQKVREARDGIGREFPRWIEASGRGAPSATALRAALEPDEAVLGTVPALNSVFLLAGTSQDVLVTRAAITREATEDAVAQLRQRLPVAGLDIEAASTLGMAVIPPRIGAHLKGVTRLRIIASGALAAVPFAALLDRKVARLDARAPFLVRRYALSQSSSFVPLKMRANTASAPRFLGVGAPTPFGTASAKPVMTAARYFRSGGVDATSLAQLPPLPGSGTELRTIGGSFGAAQATVLTGDAASEDALTALDLSRYSVLLFATHGLVSGEMEGIVEPALVLARPAPGAKRDGVLTASEIAALRLDADWVILSACNTAAGDAVGAPAFSGLAQAFRYAGARSLLLSHWPVRDDIAARISVATVAGGRKGLTRDRALQRAMLALMRDPKVGSDPFLWAPFVLIE